MAADSRDIWHCNRQTAYRIFAKVVRDLLWDHKILNFGVIACVLPRSAYGVVPDEFHFAYCLFAAESISSRSGLDLMSAGSISGRSGLDLGSPNNFGFDHGFELGSIWAPSGSDWIDLESMRERLD